MSAFAIGCASGPKYDEAAAKFPQRSPTNGRIFFYRTPSPMGAAVQPDILVNGEIVGKSAPGQFFYIDRPAGNYTVSCSTEAKHNLSITLSPDDVKYVRTTIAFGLFVGQVWPSLEDHDTAMPTLKDCTYASRDGK